MQNLHDESQVQRIVGRLHDAVIDQRHSHRSVSLSFVSAKVVRKRQQA